MKNYWQLRKAGRWSSPGKSTATGCPLPNNQPGNRHTSNLYGLNGLYLEKKHIYIHIYMCIYIYMCTYICIHIYMHAITEKTDNKFEEDWGRIFERVWREEKRNVII